MAITSLEFMLFIAIIGVIYFIVPKKIRWCILLIASYVYYFISSHELTVFLIISTLSIYITARCINKLEDSTKEKCKNQDKETKKILKNKLIRNKKLIVFIAVLINFGILITLKYGNFINLNLNKLFKAFNWKVKLPLMEFILPLGISYYTLQAISYVVDVYRGKYKAEKNIGKLALFVSFFPQMIEGPIGSFKDLAPKLFEGHSFNYERVKFSLQLILWGIFKKMVIADRAALFVNEVFESYSSYSGIVIFFAVLLYTVQIYADFSGCIDIVRGVAQIFGVDLAENFKRPFFSKNVQEFWRRWHITLGAWLREYIFYSISFSKLSMKIANATKKVFKGHIGKIIPATFALLFVWLFNGFWHGSSWKYVFYGLYYYIFTVLGMLFEPMFNKFIKYMKININSFSYKLWQVTRTSMIVLGGMLIFRAHRLTTAFDMFKSMFSFKDIDKFFNGDLFKIGFTDAKDFNILLIGIVIMLIVSILQERGYSIRKLIAKQNLIFRWLLYYGAIFSILILGIYGEGYSASNFIYGQF